MAAVAVLIYSYATIRGAQGSYWAASNQDPSYPYLLNALLIANGEAPQHIDHPGTTVQMLGATAIRVGNLRQSTDAMNRAVLSDPERSLRSINAWLLVVILAAIFIGAVVVASACESSVVTLAFLAMPLVFAEVHKQLASVTPEPLLVAIGILSSSVHLARTRRAMLQPVKAPRYGWEDASLAVLAGFGIITKVTYLPLCALPFLHLRRARHFLISALILGATVAMLLIPIYTEIPRMLTWFKDLVTHTGYYGGGASGIIDPVQYRTHVAQLMRITPVLPLIWITIVVYLGGTAWFRLRDPVLRASWLREFLLLGAGILGFLVTAKHPNAHYLIPTYLAAALLIPTLLVGIANQARWLRWTGTAVSLVLIVVGLRNTHFTLLQFQHQLRSYTTVANELSQTMKSASDKGRFVYYYRSSSPEFALHFGNGYSRRFFAETLNDIYKAPLFLNIFNGKFETYTATLEPSAVYSDSVPLLFIGSGAIDTMPAGVTFETPQGWRRTPLLSKHLAHVDLFSPPEAEAP